MTLTYIDSNIWIYFFDSETEEHEAVEKQMRTILASDELILNTITVIEVAHYLSRRLAGTELRRRISAMTRIVDSEIIGFDEDLLGKSVDLLAQYAPSGLGGRDATILATMLSYGSDCIVTQDKILKKVSENLGLKVVNPLS